MPKALSSSKLIWLFGLCYAIDGGYRGWNPCIEKHLAIFVIIFDLERTNGLNLLPDKDLKDLVDLCPPIKPYQVTKNLLIHSATNLQTTPFLTFPQGSYCPALGF
ncbi:hypothetical protein B5D77_09415 [Microcystis sp. MC19]|nr:hypothetical protein B5D77_09415 [Microcystis sp. MC19]